MKALINGIISMAVILFVVLSGNTFADEGWWTYMRTAGGVLYSQVEHPVIALEREVIIYKGGDRCDIHFLFKNTLDKEISLTVGFPVKLTIPLFGFSNLDPAPNLLQNIYGDEIFYQINDRLNSPVIDPKKQISDNFRLNLLKPKIEKMISWHAFNEMNKFWGRQRWINVAIKQDKRDIKIDSVFIESQLTDENIVIVNFHFLHRLSFPPSGDLNVYVNYSSYNVIMSTGEPFHSRYHAWYYVLGTGRTWKGPIKDCNILIPDYLKPELPACFAKIGEYKKNTVYRAVNYEPSKEDNILTRYMKLTGFTETHHARVTGFAWFFNDIDPYKHIIKTKTTPDSPVRNIAVVKDASSYLSQRTWIHSYSIDEFIPDDPVWKSIYVSNDYYKPLHHPFYSTKLTGVVNRFPVVYKNISFGPASLFDGIPESAWCEGVDGDGIGEWVAFELTENISGLAIYNGFTKGSWHLWDEKSQNAINLKNKYYDNGRVKRLDIISTDRKIVHVIELADTPQKQVFDEIKLPKGDYTMYIRDIYKGLKWEDTCLGEIDFYSASAESVIQGDEFFKNVVLDYLKRF